MDVFFSFCQKHKHIFNLLGTILIVVIFSYFTGTIKEKQKLRNGIVADDTYQITYGEVSVIEIPFDSVERTYLVEDWKDEFEETDFLVSGYPYTREVICDKDKYYIEKRKCGDGTSLTIAVQRNVENGIYVLQKDGNAVLFNYESRMATSEIYAALMRQVED